MMVHIVIIEQHLLLRLGLAALMAHLVSSDRIKTHSHDDLNHSLPHKNSTNLVLLGIGPHDPAPRLIQLTRRIYAPKKIILLSPDASNLSINGKLPGQVSGYVSTRVEGEALLSTVQSLINQYTTHPPPFNTGNGGRAPALPGAGHPASYRSAPPATANRHLQPGTSEAKLLRLSPRQYEVLVLLAQGLPIKLICERLNISLATTKGHIEAIYQRMGAHSRNEAVLGALAKGATLKIPTPPPNHLPRQLSGPLDL